MFWMTLASSSLDPTETTLSKAIIRKVTYLQGTKNFKKQMESMPRNRNLLVMSEETMLILGTVR